MAESQRLRWWQEDQQQTPQASLAIDRPLLPTSTTAPEAATYQDIGEELEAEARTRALAEQRLAEHALDFYTDKTRSLPLLKRGFWQASRLQILIALAGTLLTIFQPLKVNPFIGVALGNLLGVIAQIILYRRAWNHVRNATEPILTVYPEGIRIRDDVKDTGVIHWSEITDTSVQKGYGQSGSHLVFRLRDRSIADRFQYRNERYRPRPPKPRKGAAASPSEQVAYLLLANYLLPMDAETLAARLATYETGQPIAADPPREGSETNRSNWWQRTR